MDGDEARRRRVDRTVLRLWLRPVGLALYVVVLIRNVRGSWWIVGLCALGMLLAVRETMLLPRDLRTHRADLE